MKQITEDYCSFEIAKLLKEKGFVGEGEIGCRYGFYEQNKEYPSQINLVYDDLDNSELERNECLRFTHQMALKWLREVHDLHIVVYPWQADKEEKAIHWCCTVYKSFAHFGNDVYTNETPKSYEQAVEAALLYVLKNLI